MSEEAGSELKQELPAVLSANSAKSLSQDVLIRTWSERDKLTLRLPPARLAIDPGTRLELPLSPALWTVAKSTVDAFVVVAELHPTVAGVASVTGDSGRIVSNVDVISGPIALGLFDIPNMIPSTKPVVLIAASATTPGWKRSAVTVTFGGQEISTETARSKSVLGSAAAALAAAATDLVDSENSVEVQLLDADQWLTSCDNDALASGANLAVLGNELIQFGSADSLGAGRFRLSHLLRGRGGTEWACGSHASGELFCLLQPLAMQSIPLPSWIIGSEVAATAEGGTGATILFSGEALRPPSPVNLAATSQANGDLAISWTRRSRQGFAWLDGVDAPLGETTERYHVLLTGVGGVVETTTGEPSLTVISADLAPLGVGPALLTVTQIGDFAASHPAQLNLVIS